MLKYTFKCNFSDVKKALAQFDREVRRRMEEVGKSAVEYAVEHGSYHDVSGRTRASNKYEIEGRNNLRIFNDCPYAADLEAGGKEVISGAALFAEGELKEIFE